MNFKLGKLAAVSFIGLGYAQFAGADILQGTVTDGSGQSALEGALVTIDGLNRSTSTGRFGDYRFTGIPAGDYTVTVSYIGADPVSETVSLAQEATLDFRLGAESRYLDSVLVVGSAAAQAGAINQQRASDAIINVIDSDGLGNFPDTTVADSLARVPGISIENDQGEGRYVSIRGINTDLISASVNGVRTPSPEDRRGVLLDGVPSDLLDTIEVQKSLTPNIDADSIGGYINLKTISAFDRDGQFIRGKVETSYNEITEELSPKGTLTYSNVFGDRVGVAVSANYQDLNIQSHNNETGGPIPTDDYEQRFYDIDRQRIGLVFNLDFIATEDTELYLRALYNRYTDDEIRNKFEYRDLGEEGFTQDGNVYSLNFAEVDAELRQREEVRNIQTYSTGGQTLKDDWTFDYEVSYAYAEEDDSNNHDVAFRSDDVEGEGVLQFDLSDPQQPLISGPALDVLFDPSNYEMDAFEQEFTINEDTEWAGKFDVTRDSVFGGVPTVWKAGLKYRDREKVRDQNLNVYEPDGTIDFNLADYIRSASPISNWRLSNPMFNWPDAGLTAQLRGGATGLELNEDDTNFESLSGDYTINEKILAGFAMGTFDIDATTVVFGVRIENTDTESVGNVFAEEDDPTNVGTRSFSDNYTSVFPSLNVKHAFSDRLIARGAVYTSLVRPAFGEMRPTAAFNDDRDEIELGNPGLDPYEAYNFDLALEYYPTKLSVLSAGIFYKKIDNAIFAANFDIDEVPGTVDLSFLPDDIVAGLDEVSTFINVDDSYVAGIEFNYVQQLDFLPGLFDGLLVSGNLTLSESESTLPDGRDVPLLKQSDTVWNASIGYDKGPWDLRVSANYRGAYLDEVFGEDDDFGNIDRYTDDHLSIEASAKYEINDNFQVYAEGKNLGDEPEYYYHGNERRLSQYDEFGTSYVVGVRVTY